MRLASRGPCNGHEPQVESALNISVYSLFDTPMELGTREPKRCCWDCGLVSQSADADYDESHASIGELKS